MRKALFLAVAVLYAARLLAFPSTQPTVHATSEAISENESSAAIAQIDSTILFYFVPNTSKFLYAGNETAIQRAGRMIERHREELEKGSLFLFVNGYCSALPTETENLQLARTCSNRIKSYYITNYGLREENYITRNHATACNGDADIVATLQLVPAIPEETVETPEPEREESPVVQAENEEERAAGSTVVAESTPREPVTAVEEPQTSASEETVPETPRQTPPEVTDKAVQQTVGITRPETGTELSRWGIKTNLPAWALVVANVAAEYRFADHWSVELPLYYSCWTTARTYRFRTFAVQPSLRYWLAPEWKGHFFGLHLTGGSFNISTDTKTRYQDVNGMYGVGIDYGYAFRLSERWGLELNLGAGLIHTRYNAYYNIDNGARFDTRTKNYWGVTRCGISIIYRIK